MNWYVDVLKKYAVFEGRARRREYWMFVLFHLIAAVLLFVIGSLLGGATGLLLYALYMVATLLPNLGVLVRRLHDTGRSGWWFFISFVPIVGAIWLLVLLCTEGLPGENAYGPDPKAVAASA